jgi:hypothetical protein
VDFWVQGQPGLQSEFQDSQDYIQRNPVLKNQKKKKKKKNPTKPNQKISSDLIKIEMHLKVLFVLLSKP